MFFCFFLSNKLSSPKDLDFLERNVTKIFAKCYYKNFETFRKWRLFFFFFFRFILWKKYETAPSHSFCVRSFKQRAVYFLPHQSVYGLIFLLHQSAGYFQIVTESKFIKQIPELFHIICFPPVFQKLCPETFFFFLYGTFVSLGRH